MLMIRRGDHYLKINRLQDTETVFIELFTSFIWKIRKISRNKKSRATIFGQSGIKFMGLLRVRRLYRTIIIRA